VGHDVAVPFFVAPLPKAKNGETQDRKEKTADDLSLRLIAVTCP